jgi:hypothetical protein
MGNASISVSIADIPELARMKKSVCCLDDNGDPYGVLPAAVVQNMYIRTFAQVFRRGCYLYHPSKVAVPWKKINKKVK